MADRSSSPLNISIDADERASLEAAAKHTGVDLSNFIRGKAIEAAETALLERRLVTIPAEDWNKIEAWVDTPPKDIAALRRSSAIRSLESTRALTGDDDRYAFDCGRASLNHWFWYHAWQDQETDMARTHVAVDPVTGDIIGYVSLSAAEIKRASQPSEGITPDIWLTAIPAVMFGRFAIDQRHQGLGHARSLIGFALASAVRVSRNIGCFCMLVHPLDDRIRALFQRFGFEDIPGDPARGMAIRIIDLERNGL
ncbi:DUF1778 domain-containing protein [Sphingobium sp. 3R8]|uniref:GNAT family N-acetyltransferase n=1 Tax=Sphingobium sp. 3R8 TaxID=2874921 RepID=UPI001CCC7CD3|nr:GNAT family N-acetyltransferase [Sphingobium sp. 3R8]MBZ9650299.1 DUF1778 domain-containing protein [Sphingobium sp. 3R8]